MFGTGVLLLSRFEITETFFHRYSLNGFPQRVTHGDWYAGRGACLGSIRVPGFGNVRVAMSHLHAQYAADDDYEHHRAAQAFELGRTASLWGSVPGTSLVLVMGDMNIRPESTAYALLRAASGTGDAWGDAAVAAGGPGFTIHEDISAPRRIDYVLYRPGNAAPPGLDAAYSRVVMHNWAKHKLSAHQAASREKSLDKNEPESSHESSCGTLQGNAREILPAKAREWWEAKEQEEIHDDYFYSDHFGVEVVFALGGWPEQRQKADQRQQQDTKDTKKDKKSGKTKAKPAHDEHLNHHLNKNMNNAPDAMAPLDRCKERVRASLKRLPSPLQLHESLLCDLREAEQIASNRSSSNVMLGVGLVVLSVAACCSLALALHNKPSMIGSIDSVVSGSIVSGRVVGWLGSPFGVLGVSLAAALSMAAGVLKIFHGYVEENDEVRAVKATIADLRTGFLLREHPADQL